MTPTNPMFELARETMEVQQELAEESFDASVEMIDAVEDATEEVAADFDGSEAAFGNAFEAYRKSLDAASELFS